MRLADKIILLLVSLGLLPNAVDDTVNPLHNLSRTLLLRGKMSTPLWESSLLGTNVILVLYHIDIAIFGKHFLYLAAEFQNL